MFNDEARWIGRVLSKMGLNRSSAVFDVGAHRAALGRS